ncbi:LOW QUALITY PROTEIN: uncharacterized protein ColSpa_11795 [Colletotrichum spaethianum]|uniref:Uncharacterized protein n=1 Tax=Colletotrichum spaethianum TaxID=700344 RepID=A0AA37UKP5_9PEZI|nr:LOW QUALITY PROTEIN: uncharacterized protein ColSpa_11795 [Colletotrichum spaethianum]GKT51614.1 LOW QUALITY PROTEIN: hypothetical protein ColSpa_11795 [Colletotrichum spaethianum]
MPFFYSKPIGGRNFGTSTATAFTVAPGASASAVSTASDRRDAVPTASRCRCDDESNITYSVRVSRAPSFLTLTTPTTKPDYDIFIFIH